MPAYRFSWDAFDDATVTALAEAVGYRGTGADVRAWLASHVKRPNDDFIRKTKGMLERHWLPKYPAGCGADAGGAREAVDARGRSGGLPSS